MNYFRRVNRLFRLAELLHYKYSSILKLGRAVREEDYIREYEGGEREIAATESERKAFKEEIRDNIKAMLESNISKMPIPNLKDNFWIDLDNYLVNNKNKIVKLLEQPIDNFLQNLSYEEISRQDNYSRPLKIYSIRILEYLKNSNIVNQIISEQKSLQHKRTIQPVEEASEDVILDEGKGQTFEKFETRIYLAFYYKNINEIIDLIKNASDINKVKVIFKNLIENPDIFNQVSDYFYIHVISTMLYKHGEVTDFLNNQYYKTIFPSIKDKIFDIYFEKYKNNVPDSIYDYISKISIGDLKKDMECLADYINKNPDILSVDIIDRAPSREVKNIIIKNLSNSSVTTLVKKLGKSIGANNKGYNWDIIEIINIRDEVSPDSSENILNIFLNNFFSQLNAVEIKSFSFSMNLLTKVYQYIKNNKLKNFIKFFCNKELAKPKNNIVENFKKIDNFTSISGDSFSSRYSELEKNLIKAAIESKDYINALLLQNLSQINLSGESTQIKVIKAFYKDKNKEPAQIFNEIKNILPNINKISNFQGGNENFDTDLLYDEALSVAPNISSYINLVNRIGVIANILHNSNIDFGMSKFLALKTSVDLNQNYTKQFLYIYTILKNRKEFLYDNLPSLYEKYKDELSLSSNFIQNLNKFLDIKNSFSIGKPDLSRENLDVLVSLQTDIKKIAEIDKIKKYINIAKPKNEKLFDLNLDLGKYEFVVLKNNDPRHFDVGVDTNCCQRIGGEGEAAAIDSLINPLAGVLVLQNKVGRIIAQSYFHYIPQDNGYILDNIEATGALSKSELAQIYDEYAKLIKSKYTDIKYMKVGLEYTKIDTSKYEIISEKEDPRHFEWRKIYTDFRKNNHIDLFEFANSSKKQQTNITSNQSSNYRENLAKMIDYFMLSNPKSYNEYMQSK